MSKPIEAEREIITVAEAAVLLGVTPGRVRQLCSPGGPLPCVRTPGGGKSGREYILIRRADLELVRRRPKPGPRPKKVGEAAAPDARKSNRRNAKGRRRK